MKACDNCPFRLGTSVHLEPDRAREIADHLRRDGDFVCHKTIDHTAEDSEGRRYKRGKNERPCVGAEIASIRSGKGPSQWTRILCRVGKFDGAALEAAADDPTNAAGVVSDLDEFEYMHEALADR